MSDATTTRRQINPVGRNCPTWCTDHVDNSEPREWMAEHRDAPRTSWATRTDAEGPAPATVQTAQWEDEEGRQPRRIVLAVPADMLGETSLDSSQARALVESLQAALDALGDD